MKARDMYELVERLDSRNIVKSRQVLIPKFDNEGLVSNQKAQNII